MLMLITMIYPVIMGDANSSDKIPVILDTDIGGDIDDTWALAMMLKSPELDVKLVVTDTGNTTYRVKVAAKMLEIAGRTDFDVFPHEWAQKFRVNDLKVLEIRLPLELEEIAPQGDGLHTYISVTSPCHLVIETCMA